MSKHDPFVASVDKVDVFNAKTQRRRDAKKKLLETLRLPRTAPLSGAGVRLCVFALKSPHYHLI
jgi:hypothetical protein